MDPTQDRFDRLWKGAERNVRGAVAKHARSATRDDREDIVQTVRVKAWQGFGAHDSGRSFVNWVCRIAQNASVDWIRADVRRRELDALDLAAGQADFGASPLDLATADEVCPELRETVSHLPPTLRETFLLRFGGHTLDEVAALMECTDRTVRSRRHHATARLRELLGPDFLASRGLRGWA